jgi:ATP synthase F1 delta subunit
VNPSLQGYSAAVLEDAAAHDETARLADDLAAIDQVIGRTPALRAALTDTAVSATARRAVLLELFESKVSDGARRAVAFAGATVRAPEVPAAATWLAHRAHLAAEGVATDEPLLGHLDARTRVGGFAAAIFEDLATDRLEEVENELFRFARIVESTPTLRTVLTDRDVPGEVRRGVVDELLADKVQPATRRLVDFVIDAGRTRDTVGTLDWLVEQTASARGWRVARVTAAAEVDGDERGRLSDSLSRLAGTSVELQVTMEPALLAGVVVRIGDLQVDATARDRLERLREHMTSGAWNDSGFAGAGSGTEPRGAH